MKPNPDLQKQRNDGRAIRTDITGEDLVHTSDPEAREARREEKEIARERRDSDETRQNVESPDE